ncbi:MAG: hypothetical protein N3F08_02590 [Crenarchaeota archaeon]|nr:hypothetical protein [Thermoproteota archaeon]
MFRTGCSKRKKKKIFEEKSKEKKVIENLQGRFEKYLRMKRKEMMNEFLTSRDIEVEKSKRRLSPLNLAVIRK